MSLFITLLVHLLTHFILKLLLSQPASLLYRLLLHLTPLNLLLRSVVVAIVMVAMAMAVERQRYSRGKLSLYLAAIRFNIPLVLSLLSLVLKKIMLLIRRRGTLMSMGKVRGSPFTLLMRRSPALASELLISLIKLNTLILLKVLGATKRTRTLRRTMFISLVQSYMLFYNMVYELANEIYSSEEKGDHCSDIEKTPKQRLVLFVAF